MAQAGGRARIGYLALGLVSASVFLATDRPWVQAAAQLPIYALSGGLMGRRWWLARHADPDSLLTLAALAFGVYFAASIVAVLVPLLVSSTATVPVPSPLDVMFLVSYALLGLFLWRLGSRSDAARRHDLLDMLIVVGGSAPVFWVFLIQPLLWRSTPTIALITYLAYPISVFGLFGLTVRLAFVARRQPAFHLLLTGWIVGELSADVIFLRASIDDSYSYGQPWQALWILSAACVGTLALLPERDLPAARRPPAYVTSTPRLWLLAGCFATPILTVGYVELGTDHSVGVLFAAAASLFLVFLIGLRLSDLTMDNAAQVLVQEEMLLAQEQMQQMSGELLHQARHDPLTGIGNRLLFAERVDDMLARGGLEENRATAFLLLDLDDFKMVNDTFGHESGDQVLIEVSRRLQKVTLRNGSVFRLGGDEFVIALEHATLEDAVRLADQVDIALSEPLDLGPRQIRPSACIGISVALQGQDRSTLLAEADLAMYGRKTRGGHGPGMFDAALHRLTLDRHQLDGNLLDAAVRQEMSVVFQPLVHLSTERMVGVEALLRWDHPTRGAVSPSEFIPLAEANGAIIELGEWVLLESLKQLSAWDESGTGRPLRLSVNVSPRQLADKTFVGRVSESLRLTGIIPGRLTLEITEAAFAIDAEATIGRLEALKELGLLLAIDDFGTEYSSLSRLRRIPFDILKIDKSFVDKIATLPAERAVTATIVSLATSLGKTAIAEGIETDEQLRELLDLEVAYGQGFLFAKPLDAAGITTLLDGPRRSLGRCANSPL